MKNSYLKKRVKSFACAFEGIKQLIKTEQHAQIHCIVAGVAILLAIWLDISNTEWAILTLTIAAVISAEGFNSAIERLADAVTLERHPLIGTAKDLAAGAVLTTAIASIVIGAFIFIPKLIAIA